MEEARRTAATIRPRSRSKSQDACNPGFWIPIPHTDRRGIMVRSAVAVLPVRRERGG